ncbi:uncharacterized protein LOC141680341 [Apium graveolens]|uniref:uncharacterized protein LOC141680341 n=1 Tax=Apium graveolens TaxID=4045 RepID=UPI003D7A49A4
MENDKDEINEGLVNMRKPGLRVFPVSPYASGEGLPYAPVDWPCPGDKWRWKVGKRIISSSGYFLDRYLYLPDRLYDKSKRRGFASKVSVANYVRETYHGRDVKAFFDSFSWKRATSGCKAGNKLCSSLIETGKPHSRTILSCDIYCSEPGFCGDCCCILCRKTIDFSNEGYNFIRCEATVEKSCICGHLAHLDCGLKSYMAGIVGGRVCLDVEYYCRRCDTRTDLLPHVKKFLKICETIDSHDDINKILKLGVSVLHGSQRRDANRLLNIFELAIEKQHGSRIKSGTALDDVWNVDKSLAGSPKNVYENFDHVEESLKMDHHISLTLQALKTSKEWEFNIAKERLHEQKSCIQNLYQQQDKEKTEVAPHILDVADPNDVLHFTGSRVNKINKELRKLENMKEVSKGFARTSKEVLKNHFGLEM